MTDNYSVLVSRENAVGKLLAFAKGYCSQDLDNPNNPPLDFDTGLANYKSKVASGEIDEKDLKFRVNNPYVKDNGIFMPLGVTCWQEYQRDQKSAKDIEGVNRLRRLSAEHYQDELAFFARPLGMEVLPITRDGNIALIYRNPENHEFFQGEYNGMCKFVKFKENPENLDIEDEILSGFQSKLNISQEHLDGSPELVGIVQDLITGGMAISYLQKLKIASTELQGLVSETDIKMLSIKALKAAATSQKRDESMNFPFHTRYLIDVLKDDDLKID